MNRSSLARLTVLPATLALLIGVIPPSSAAGPTTFKATRATLGAIPDGAASDESFCAFDGEPRDVAVPVKLKGTVTDVQVSLALEHTYLGDLTVTLIAPDGTSAVVFDTTGYSAEQFCGSNADLRGTYAFADGATKKWWRAAARADVVPGGTYAPSDSFGMSTAISPAFEGVKAKGSWTIRIVDGGEGDVGSVGKASLTLTTDG